MFFQHARQLRPQRRRLDLPEPAEREGDEPPGEEGGDEDRDECDRDVDERAMVSKNGSFGGLSEDSPLFLSKKGTWRKFAFNTKRYKTQEGVKEVLVCSSLENLIRDILKGAGIQGGSSHSGRRTLATWLDRKGCDLELIRYILNHEDPDMTIEYIDPSEKRIELAYKSLMTSVKMPNALKLTRPLSTDLDDSSR